MRKGAGQGPPGFGCGEDTLAVNKAVGPLALVPASNHLPTPTHTSATTHSPHPAPASVAPPRHTSASVMSCRKRATPPPDGHARRPETRQAPRARAARTCVRWARCRCRAHGACRCAMRPRTCHPMQSTPPQPPQPRPSQPPHPVTAGPAHAARVPHGPAAVGVGHCALPVSLAAAPLARVGPIAKRVRALALLRLRHALMEMSADEFARR